MEVGDNNLMHVWPDQNIYIIIIVIFIVRSTEVDVWFLVYFKNRLLLNELTRVYVLHDIKKVFKNVLL